MLLTPVGLSQVEKTFGKLKYTNMSGGNVDLDDTWERDNLVTLRNVCKTGLNIRLHRLVAPSFESCLFKTKAICPGYKIRMLGGHCARFKMHDPKRGLSTHSWGIAFDINWDKNPVSSKLITDIPEEFVQVFVQDGWDWGGNWKDTKDSMHFQFAKGY